MFFFMVLVVIQDTVARCCAAVPVVEISRSGTGLLADTQFLLGDEGAVTVDVLAHQVIEQFAALTYQHLK